MSHFLFVSYRKETKIKNYKQELISDSVKLRSRKRFCSGTQKSNSDVKRKIHSDFFRFKFIFNFMCPCANVSHEIKFIST